MWPNRKKALGVLKLKKIESHFHFPVALLEVRMLNPLLINRALKPRAMKVDFGTLPVNWMANKKAWVTTAVFAEWYNILYQKLENI